MQSAPHPKVSVVIPTWTRSDLLAGCLAALRRQTFTNFGVVVVSNGADARAAKLASEFGALLIHFPQNRGFAAAVNAGIAAADSQYILLLNDDVELDSNWLQQATTVLDEKAEFAFSTGKIYRSDGTHLDNAGDALSLAGSAWRLGFGRRDSAEFDFPKPLLAVPATAALFRRSVFSSVGGFDEDFFSYLEDMDFSVRAARAGLRGLYWPQAVARHHGGATLGGADSAAVFELVTRNQVLLLAKHYPLQLLVRLSPRIFWAQLGRALMAVKKGMAWAYCRGMVRAAIGLPRAIGKRERWSRTDVERFWTWLRASESAIYEDMPASESRSQSRFWWLYFRIFGSSRLAAAAAKANLDRLPGSGPHH